MSGLRSRKRIGVQNRPDLLVRAGQSYKAGQPLVHSGYPQNGGVVVKDTLVPNRANDDDVLKFTALRPGESGSKLDEHPSPVMVGGDDQHGVSCQHGLQILGCELGGDFRQ